MTVNADLNSFFLLYCCHCFRFKTPQDYLSISKGHSMLKSTSHCKIVRLSESESGGDKLVKWVE